MKKVLTGAGGLVGSEIEADVKLTRQKCDLMNFNILNLLQLKKV